MSEVNAHVSIVHKFALWSKQKGYCPFCFTFANYNSTVNGANISLLMGKLRDISGRGISFRCDDIFFY